MRVACQSIKRPWQDDIGRVFFSTFNRLRTPPKKEEFKSEGRPTDCVRRRSKKSGLAWPDAVRVGSDEHLCSRVLARLSRSPCGQLSSAAIFLIFKSPKVTPKLTPQLLQKKNVLSFFLANAFFLSPWEQSTSLLRKKLASTPQSFIFFKIFGSNLSASIHQNCQTVCNSFLSWARRSEV